MRHFNLQLTLGFWLFLSLYCIQIQATEPEPKAPVIVAISAFSPFVILDSDLPINGFSIDLWHLIAEKIGVKFEFKIYEGVKAKLDALESKEIDIAIGGISQTAARERVFDFSHPSYYAGLDILIKKQTETGIWVILKQLFLDSGQFLFKSMMLTGLILIVVAGHIIWFAEKGQDSFNDRYFQGVGQGMYWVVVTASTVGYGDFSPLKPIGRLVTVLIILFTLPLFGIFVSELSSTLTTLKINGHIQSTDDLFRKHIGVLANTTSETSVQKRHLSYQSYKNMSAAMLALEKDEIDAFIFDAPSLHYYVKHQANGSHFRVVDNRFDYQILAFATLNKSPLLEKVNWALLSVKESGQYDELKKVWFNK